MRAAIAGAEVGDDALGDDPTTRRLEETVAALLGKERALFFPTGAMANQSALAVHGRRGGEIVVEAGAHVLNYEDGAAAALSGIQLRAIFTPDGQLTADRLREAIPAPSRYLPRTTAIAVENTHLVSGGRVMPVETAAAIAELARERGLKVHLDGARLWNACAASGQSPADYASHADTAMVALSKALGCPVGSMLAGDAETMEEAWRMRRRFGGSLRQSGLLAAAGLHALEHHRDAIHADHERARRLARGVGALPGIRVGEPETNVVLIDLDTDTQVIALLAFLELNRILMLKFGTRRLRAVTHRDVDDEGIARAIAVFGEWATARRPD
ncbi:MAG: low specificity L-threonine aldolase [Gemmatimonadetes bacterium]|nr:low specificity L-threonine aldolase [Gemmatimonadota bacterium]